MTMYLIWGEWRSDQELQQIAHEMNSIGRNIEMKTKGVADWIEKVEKMKQQNGGLIF